MAKVIDTITVKIDLEFSLWTAIKLRLAGIAWIFRKPIRPVPRVFRNIK